MQEQMEESQETNKTLEGNLIHLKIICKRVGSPINSEGGEIVRREISKNYMAITLI